MPAFLCGWPCNQKSVGFARSRGWGSPAPTERPLADQAWRKLHLGVDETTKEMVAVEVTPSQVHDSGLLPTLLDQIPGCIVQVSGDGAYDTRSCY